LETYARRMLETHDSYFLMISNFVQNITKIQAAV